MNRMAAVLVAVALLAALPSTTHAAPIAFDGFPPDQRFVYFGDTDYDYTAAAMTFSLSVGSSTIAGAQWWGGCFGAASGDLGSPDTGTAPNECPAGNFVLSFYREDGANAPGTLVQSFNVGGGNQTATGNAIGTNDFITEYSYSATFPSLVLVPGQVYWLAISNTVTGTTWGWESAGGEDSHQQFDVAAAVWVPQADNLAFNLLGPDVTPLPEPAVWSLVAFGLGGAALRKRRRR